MGPDKLFHSASASVRTFPSLQPPVTISEPPSQALVQVINHTAHLHSASSLKPKSQPKLSVLIYFSSLHRTETTLVTDTNDLLLAADIGMYLFEILLDLSSAFDTMDDNVLINSQLMSSMLTSVIWLWIGSGSYGPSLL